MITCIGQASPLVRDMKWRFSQGRMRMMDRLEKGMDGNVMILAPPRVEGGVGGAGKVCLEGEVWLSDAFRSNDLGQCDPDVCETLKKYVRIYKEAVVSGRYEGI